MHVPVDWNIFRSLELALQVVVSYPKWALGTKLGSSVEQSMFLTTKPLISVFEMGCHVDGTGFKHTT